jgi:hypothetical protein
VREQQSPEAFPRHLKPTAVGKTIPLLLKTAFNRRGFANHALLHHWSEIFGSPLGEYTRPLKIIFAPSDNCRNGTIHIGVANAFALQAQHSTPLFLEKINNLFGYPAIARVKLIHFPIKDFIHPPPKKELPDAIPIRLPDTKIDDALKIALARLGGYVKR